MSDNKEIWVLGTKNSNADKSFLWNEDIPNISDADIVIVDLNTLTKTALNLITDGVDDLRSELKDKLSNKGIVVFIIGDYYTTSDGFSNYDICPFSLDMEGGPEGKKLIYDKKNNPFSDYLNHVKKFDYFIDTVTMKSELRKEFSGYGTSVGSQKKFDITDNSGRTLGGCFNVRAFDGDKLTGNCFVLPPVTSISATEGITEIISFFKENKDELPPNWVNDVEVSGLNEINESIAELETKKEGIYTEISSKTEEKNKLFRYLGLLYAQDTQLENIVMEAFKLLRFDEIRRERNQNDEDWLIDLPSIDDLKFGLLEVKGRKVKTTQGDIVQCNKWTDDYLQMDPSIKTKGIFISNQFRLDSYPNSQEKRAQYEPNELDYAKTRRICIIPSYVLFEAVNKILSGARPKREEIEKLIVETDGILKKISDYNFT